LPCLAFALAVILSGAKDPEKLYSPQPLGPFNQHPSGGRFEGGHSLFQPFGKYLGKYTGILLRSAKPYGITNQSQSLGIQRQEKPNKARGNVK
jgi:hypothetical protein